VSCVYQECEKLKLLKVSSQRVFMSSILGSSKHDHEATQSVDHHCLLLSHSFVMIIKTQKLLACRFKSVFASSILSLLDHYSDPSRSSIFLERDDLKEWWIYLRFLLLSNVDILHIPDVFEHFQDLYINLIVQIIFTTNCSVIWQ